MPSFLKLVKKHFDDDLEFNIKTHIESFHSDDDYESTQLDHVPICEILPGTKFIAKDDDFNITYQGKECHATSYRLYKYKNYFIVYIFDTEGDDMDVLDIKDNYGSDLIKFYNECVTVYKKDELDIGDFLDSSKNIDFVMEVFKKIYPKTGLTRLQEYISDRYSK